MSARAVALRVVRDVFPDAGLARGAQEALEYRARAEGLDARDRAFATELAYGSIKMRRTLDWYLQPFIGERKEPLPPLIAEILRLAVFELTYTRADEHATVFEFVNLAKRFGHRGVANLVNAVLRNVLRAAPQPPQRAQFASDDDYVATRYSLPTWIVRQWRTTFGDRVEEVCAGVNEPAAFGIVVNARVEDPTAALERLRGRGIEAARSHFVEESILVENGALAREESSANGAWWVQSESAAMPVDILNPQADEAIVDVCSGRGNKALQIAARLDGTGTITCLEREARKASVLTARLESVGLGAAIVIGDATHALLPEGRRFDRVLVDAPCSGLGVLGRHPEARWKKQPGDGERLSRTQAELLERQAASVHDGGVLVYAVCSTDPRETVGVVDSFLSKHGFERGLIPARYEPFITDGGDVLIPPGIGGRDGFYIARLERR